MAFIHIRIVDTVPLPFLVAESDLVSAHVHTHTVAAKTESGKGTALVPSDRIAVPALTLSRIGG
jgi:hypothetical protein